MVTMQKQGEPSIQTFSITLGSLVPDTAENEQKVQQSRGHFHNGSLSWKQVLKSYKAIYGTSKIFCKKLLENLEVWKQFLNIQSKGIFTNMIGFAEIYFQT